MATIETAVRTMLTSATELNGITDARITHGYRLQDAALPAITFEVQQDATQTIGASPLLMVSVEIRVIATTTGGALDELANVKAAVRTGTFDGIVFSAVLWNGHTIDESVGTDGDEADPVELVCNADIYYTE